MGVTASTQARVVQQVVPTSEGQVTIISDGDDGDDLGVELLPIKWSESLAGTLQEDSDANAPPASDQQNQVEGDESNRLLPNDGMTPVATSLSTFHGTHSNIRRCSLRMCLTLAVVAAIVGTMIFVHVVAPMRKSRNGERMEPNEEDEEANDRDSCWNLSGNFDTDLDSVHRKRKVSLSSDGNVLAVSTPSIGVRIYEDHQSGEGWKQRGDTIEYSNSDKPGWSSISLSGDGNVVAIGLPLSKSPGHIGKGEVSVYEFDNSSKVSWMHRGNTVHQQTEHRDYFGDSVSLSSDGTTIAVGDVTHDNGFRFILRVYRIDTEGGLWKQIGQDIEGIPVGDVGTYSVPLSSDGSAVAVGALLGDGDDMHHIRVYAFDSVNNMWSQLGANVDDRKVDVHVGHFVSLSSDGSVLAVGTPFDGDNHRGIVRVYKLDIGNDGGRWVQQGNEIVGEWDEDNSGRSLSLSSNGLTVAISAPHGRCIDSNCKLFHGRVRVYKMNKESEWIKQGQDIIGGKGAANQYADQSISMSSDGSVVAVGGMDGGHVYEYGRCDGPDRP